MQLITSNNETFNFLLLQSERYLKFNIKRKH